MTQTTWKQGRRYLVNGREFMYYTEALAYARYLFKLVGGVVELESINKGESK